VLNKVIPTRTPKERYQATPEKFIQRVKKRYVAKSNEILQQKKKYYATILKKLKKSTLTISNQNIFNWNHNDNYLFDHNQDKNVVGNEHNCDHFPLF